MSLREKFGWGASDAADTAEKKVESKEQIIKRLREQLKNVEDVDQLSSLLPYGSSISVYRRPRAGGELELLDSYNIDNVDSSILELIKENYGGGRYAINVLYEGDYVKRISFAVAGKPKRTNASAGANDDVEASDRNDQNVAASSKKTKYVEGLEGQIRKLEESISDMQARQQESELLSQIRSMIKESIKSELEPLKQIASKADRSDGSGSAKMFELITSTLSPLLTTFISMVDPSKTAKSLTSLVDVAKSMGLIPTAGAAAGAGNLSASGSSGSEGKGDTLESGGFGGTIDQLLKMALNNERFMENIARVVEALRGKSQAPAVEPQQNFGFGQPQSPPQPQPQSSQSQQTAQTAQAQLATAINNIRNMVRIGIAPDSIAEQIVNLIYGASQAGLQVVDLAKLRGDPAATMNEMLGQFPEFHSTDGLVYKEKIVSAIIQQLYDNSTDQPVDQSLGQSTETESTSAKAD